MNRVKIGDSVRTYGFCGVYTVQPVQPDSFGVRPESVFIQRNDNPYGGFPVPESSIVEVNGVAVPLLSAPIVPPATDYPHVPQFEYTDGPQSLGQDALRIWKERFDMAALEDRS